MSHHVLTNRFKLPEGSSPVACVDIGGTKVAVNIVDALGVRGKVAEPTAVSGHNDALAQQIIRLICQRGGAGGVAIDALVRVWLASCGPFVLNHGQGGLAPSNM